MYLNTCLKYFKYIYTLNTLYLIYLNNFHGKPNFFPK
uniref:Uncharacterized protein n=1 Tax=Anguilla anguilla TaxID=7936 RepID=A0A0E9Q0I0_ANGAN